MKQKIPAAEKLAEKIKEEIEKGIFGEPGRQFLSTRHLGEKYSCSLVTAQKAMVRLREEGVITLSGKKYHGKKNHVNKFKKTYENWEYVSMSSEHAEEAFQLLLKWKNLNLCMENHDKNAESCVACNYLRLFDELEVCGGLLRVDGQAVAFCIGEQVCDDTMVVHIEKALTEYECAYTMINQQFVEHECQHVTYVNREEDTGDEGLRKAKLSYRPVFMVEKGTVTRKK